MRMYCAVYVCYCGTRKTEKTTDAFRVFPERVRCGCGMWRRKMSQYESQTIFDSDQDVLYGRA